MGNSEMRTKSYLGKLEGTQHSEERSVEGKWKLKLKLILE